MWERDDAAPIEWSSGMRSGKVKWFNAVKGFGFIADDNGGEDVFVHFSAVEMEGFKALEENQGVAYEAEPSPKGLKATKVVPIAASRQAA